MFGKNVTRDQPDPPDSIPKYIREGVERQDVQTLQAIATWATQLAEWQESVDVDEIESDLDDEEKIDDVVEDTGGGTLVEKMVPCGKDCGGCPHGPYTYRVTRSGDSLDWEYLGKTETN